jgi:hypothetical protein
MPGPEQGGAPPTVPLRVSQQQPAAAANFPPIATPTNFRARAAPLIDAFQPIDGTPFLPAEALPQAPAPLPGYPLAPEYPAAPDYLRSPVGYLPPGSGNDVLALAQERAGGGTSGGMLALWFALAAALGVGVTLAVAALLR